jgi:hypothetical protein
MTQLAFASISLAQAPNSNALALFLDGADGVMKVKDIRGVVAPLSDYVSGGGGGGSVFFNTNQFTGAGTSVGDPINIKLQTTGEDAVLTFNSNGLGVALASTTIPTATRVNAWSYFKNDGTTPFSIQISSVSNWGSKTTYGTTASSNSVSSVTGSKLTLTSAVTMPSAGSGEANPTGATSSVYTIPVPFPTSFPATFNLATSPTINIATTTSFAITFTKLKSGLVVSGSQVVKASGNDSSAITSTATFFALIKGGFSTSNTPNQSMYDTLADGSLFFSTFGSSMTFTLPRSASATEYLVFVLPSTINITEIIYKGANDIIGAFTISSATSITNETGATASVKFYVSNNVQAFNSGDTLRFQ